MAEIKDGVLIKLTQEDIVNGVCVIPSEVTKIGSSSMETPFKGLNISKLIIPSSVQDVEAFAFAGCRIDELVIEGGTKLGYMFLFTSNVNKVILLGDAKLDQAFNSAYIQDVRLPENISGYKDSFTEDDMEYAYKDTLGYWHLSAQMPPDENVEAFSLVPVKRCIKGYDPVRLIEFVETDKYGDFIKLVIKLNEKRQQVSWDLIEVLDRNEMLSDFADKGVLTFFNNEVANVEKHKDYAWIRGKELYQIALTLGCFSNEPMKDAHGKDTSVIMAQKASTTLAYILKNAPLSISLLRDVFIKNEGAKPNSDFLNFISTRGEKGEFTNLNLLIELEKEHNGIFAKVVKDFDEVKEYRNVVVDGKTKKLSWKNAIEKFHEETFYNNMTSENEATAKLFARKGITQSGFDEMLQIKEEQIKSDMPHHILGKELKEETILEAIERIRRDTESMIGDARELIDSLYEKQFTFEMLDKYDDRGAILGVYCDCCATIDGHAYGADIARASITKNDVQNMVIKDAKGDIVCKGTLYVNTEKGYIVINDFEINGEFRDHETDQPGRYAVPEDSKDEQTRDKIFDTFMRGIASFIKEYDKQHPEKPIQIVNVGTTYNRLKNQIERYEKATTNLEVPAEYHFEDAEEGQYTLYRRSDLENQKQAQMEENEL